MSELSKSIRISAVAYKRLKLVSTILSLNRDEEVTLSDVILKYLPKTPTAGVN